MCLAGSSDILSITAPTCTCAGETSTVAGGRAGVAATPLGLTAAAVAAVASSEITGDGLAAGLASTAGDGDGAPAAEAETHPAVTTRLASGPIEQKRAFLSRRKAGVVRSPGIDQSPLERMKSHNARSLIAIRPLPAGAASILNAARMYGS